MQEITHAQVKKVAFLIAVVGNLYVMMEVLVNQKKHALDTQRKDKPSPLKDLIYLNDLKKQCFLPVFRWVWINSILQLRFCDKSSYRFMTNKRCATINVLALVISLFCFV